jgi:protein-tyrosine phosphatase
MAEGLFRKVLADRLGCSEDELPDRGYTVASAGLAAGHNMPAAREAVDAAREYGANLIGHASQPLTAELLEQCDRVFTMTRGHMDSILIARPDLADRVSLLAADGSDISDPIGSGPDEYEQCCREIIGHVRAVVDELPRLPRG